MLLYNKIAIILGILVVYCQLKYLMIFFHEESHAINFNSIIYMNLIITGKINFAYNKNVFIVIFVFICETYELCFSNC